MNRLLVVDGSNLLFQMFYGMPSRIVNAHGKAIQGTLGFVGALLKIIRMTSPTHTVVLFDGETQNDRVLIDANYKANRTDYSQLPEDQTPFSQLPDIYSALEFLGVLYAETYDCEADDWISEYALRYSGNTEVIISSFDSDFFQLIDENIRVLRYRSDKTVICDMTYIEQKLSIKPSQYADFKSLTGDSADNIKGADKIGPKTAAWLLNQFSTLEEIIENAELITRSSVKESLLANAERLRRNYSLIKLNGCKSLPFSLEELEYRPGEITTSEVLKGIGLR